MKPMSNLKTSLLSILAIMVCLGGWLGCHDDQAIDKLAQIQNPVLDFTAIYAEEESAGEYSQVFLKIALKNYHGDILKFGLSSPAAHQERIQYFIRDWKQSIALVAGSDTIPCTDSHMERMHMDLPYRNFILTFKQSSIGDLDHLLIEDTVYSNQLIKLSIDKSYD